MIINLVVAATENNVIGKDNQLLWHLPNDMAFFKNVTWGMPVVMGRKTFDSLGKPLKGRTNIVMTSNGSFASEGVVRAANVKEALEQSASTDAKQCYVIGGGEIFKAVMPQAARIYMTRVHTTLEGDTYFPEIKEEEWELITSLSFDKDDKHAYSYTFETWQRK